MISPKLLARTLGEMGIVTAAQIERALAAQRQQGKRIGSLLVELGALKSEQMGQQLAAQLGVLPSSAPLGVDAALTTAVTAAMAQEHRVVPVAVQGDRLQLATDQLFNALAVEYLSSLAQRAAELVLVDAGEWDRVFAERYAHAGAGSVSVAKAAPAMASAASVAPSKPLAAAVEAAEGEGGDAPIVRLVDQLIDEAFRQRSSDIHIEPLEERMRIRFRIDGVLREVPSPPRRLHGSVVSRIKILAGMDIAEKRLPQDGRIQRTVGDRPLDFRVSSLPSLHGEAIVMRILDKASVLIGVEELGLAGEALDQFRHLITLPYGMVLVTGPTGSGKTTTLYAALSTLNTPKKKLITVEDPVEYQMPGINQVQVRPQVGLTFAQGLRAMLRQAPDVIMVGEIRDAETAQVAIQAALTGHLVFSTLHTNDAPGAITRLIDMGVPPYLVASTVQGVLAQRLIRKVCDACKTAYAPGLDELAPFLGMGGQSAGESLFAKGVGCVQCSNTGFRGRLGVFEFFLMTDPLRELVYARASSAAIRERACQLGMRTLKRDGWEKASRGATALSEVLRVISDET